MSSGLKSLLSGLTPGAVEGAPLEENCGSYAWAVVDCVMFYVEDEAHKASTRRHVYIDSHLANPINKGPVKPFMGFLPLTGWRNHDSDKLFRLVGDQGWVDALG